MQAIPAIRAVASTLSLEPAAHAASAEGQFLAAVDRLGPADAVTLCSTSFTDAVGDRGDIYVTQPTGTVDRPSQGAALDAARVRLSLHPDTEESQTLIHAFTPDEAEARGYELIAAAAVARLSAEG